MGASPGAVRGTHDCQQPFDQTLDAQYPPCASLPDGFGSGSALGAADVGCVDTTHAGLGSGLMPRRMPRSDLRVLDDRSPTVR